MGFKKYMKILWLTIDRSKRATQHFDAFRNEVKKIADVTDFVRSTSPYCAGEYSRNAMYNGIEEEKILDKFDINSFDFIFTDALFAFLKEDWINCNVPKGFLIEDIHEDIPAFQINFAKENNFEYLFHRYNFGFFKMHKSVLKDFACILLPHCIDTKLFKSYKTEKINKILFTGTNHIGIYPYRNKIFDALRGKDDFVYFHREVDQADKLTGGKIREDYAMLLSSYKASFTGGSKFNLPVLKYFEVPACNSLLVSNWFSDLGVLGFIPNKNMIVLEDDIEKQADEILKNSYFDIIKAGKELVEKYHTVSLRAKQFVNYINVILKKEAPFSVEDIINPRIIKVKLEKDAVL